MKIKITSQTTVAELLDGRPEMIPLFLSRRMACVGCDMSRFETLEDAANIYRVDFAAWMAAIEQLLAQYEDNQTDQTNQKGKTQ